MLQYLLIAVGTAASAYCAHRVATAHQITGGRPCAQLTPCVALIALFAAVNVYLSAHPMAHRM